MRLGQDCPREARKDTLAHSADDSVSMRLGQDCPRECVFAGNEARSTTGFNEAGARLPQRGQIIEVGWIARITVSMRLGQDCPREETIIKAKPPKIAVSMRLGQDCPREQVSCRMRFAHQTVSMRLGQDCPRERATASLRVGSSRCFNEAGARLPQRVLSYKVLTTMTNSK